MQGEAGVGQWAAGLKEAYAQAQMAGEVGGQAPPIIYSSRTHSQLAQVIRELKRTSYRWRYLALIDCQWARQ